MNTSATSTEGPSCHEYNAENDYSGERREIITVICPKHGEHEHAIISNIEGHEGVWCQLCWLESLGPSAPYRKRYEDDDTDS